MQSCDDGLGLRGRAMTAAPLAEHLEWLAITLNHAIAS
jgi:hypothetical protein